jgi:VanZ family protein
VSGLPLKQSGPFILTLILTTTILLGAKLPGDSRLIHALQDSGHFLIFTLLTLAALWPYRKLSNRPVWLIMSLLLLFGILIEAVQSLIGREPSLYDLFMDLLGIAAGGVLYAGIMRRTFTPGISMVISLLLTLAAFSAPLHWLTVYQVRAAQFPRLIDLDNSFSRELIEGSLGGVVQHIEVPEDWLMPPDVDVASCAYVSLLEGRWPGLLMREPEADWHGYEKLELGIYSDQPIALPLRLRVHDQSHNNQYHDRYNRRLTLQPGYNHFSLPLSEIVNAPKGRTMDLSEISSVVIFASHEHVGKGFCLISMELH